MKQRMIKIIETLRDVEKQQEMNISDNILFSEACSCYRCELGRELRSSNRENTIREYPNKETTPTQKSNKPTDGQAKYLKNNRKELIECGFKVDEVKTGKDAWKIINAHQEMMR